MADYKFIEFSREGGRADLVFNNPPFNLLTVPMLEEIVDALDRLRDDETLKVLLIRGKGEMFCGGTQVEDLMADTIGMMMPTYSRLLDYLNSINGIIISAIHGEAIGSGAEIAGFCDITIAAESAKLSFPDITMGLFPPVATAILPRLIGRNRSLDWIISGRKISAKEAVESHLVARVIPDSVLETYADSYAAKIASFSAPAVVLAKRAVDEALYTPVMEAMRTTESTYMLDLMSCLDPHEGLKAHIEGREPEWKDK